MNNQFTDVTNLAEGLVLNDFDRLSFGNAELQNGLSHSLSLFYRSFNLFNNTNVFARVAYNKNIDQIIESFYEVRLKFYGKRKAYWLEKMKEDLDALLSGENLSEEFVQKASTIFEAAVIARAEEVIAEA